MREVTKGFWKGIALWFVIFLICLAGQCFGQSLSYIDTYIPPETCVECGEALLVDSASQELQQIDRPDGADEKVVKDLGLYLTAYQAEGTLVLLLNGACDYQIKLPGWFLDKPWTEVETIDNAGWSIKTEATKGIFTAICCTDHLCTPITIGFEATIWDGTTPDLADLVPKRVEKLTVWECVASAALILCGVVVILCLCLLFTSSDR
jgi:hypothetical protein